MWYDIFSENFPCTITPLHITRLFTNMIYMKQISHMVNESGNEKRVRNETSLLSLRSILATLIVAIMTDQNHLSW